MTVTMIRKPSGERTLYSRSQQEKLVADSRAGMTPSQMVERKLIGLLRGNAFPVSQLVTAAKGRGFS